MLTLYQVYFLECCSKKTRSSTAPSYLIGPYLSEEEATRRGATIVEQDKEQKTAIRLRAMNANQVGSDRIVVEGTRVFGLWAMTEVLADGSIRDQSNELRYPNDYFESGHEFV